MKMKEYTFINLSFYELGDDYDTLVLSVIEDMQGWELLQAFPPRNNNIKLLFWRYSR